MSYGLDTWCFDSYQSGRFARGPMVVVQALYRRLITPRGTLRGGDDEENYGIDLAGLVGSVGYPTAIAAIPGIIRGELMKDDRVLDVTAAVTPTQDTNGDIELAVVISGKLQDEGEDFSLSLAVTDVSVEIIGGVAA